MVLLLLAVVRGELDPERSRSRPPFPFPPAENDLVRLRKKLEVDAIKPDPELLDDDEGWICCGVVEPVISVGSGGRGSGFEFFAPAGVVFGDGFGEECGLSGELLAGKYEDVGLIVWSEVRLGGASGADADGDGDEGVDWELRLFARRLNLDAIVVEEVREGI